MANNPNEESLMERKYNEYLNSSDRTKVIDGVTYYKAVNVDVFTIRNEKCYSICLANDMFGREPIKSIKDEYGNILQLGSPAFFRFIGDIPEWYMRCGVFLIKCSEIKGTIGKFFTVVEE